MGKQLKEGLLSFLTLDRVSPCGSDWPGTLITPSQPQTPARGIKPGWCYFPNHVALSRIVPKLQWLASFILPHESAPHSQSCALAHHSPPHWGVSGPAAGCVWLYDVSQALGETQVS